MTTIKNLLAQNITTSPDTLQFAKDRKYEESWVIPLSSYRPSDEDIRKYVEKESFEHVIAEYIWNSSDDDNRFVLTVFHDTTCIVKDPSEFISTHLTLFYGYQGFIKFIQSIDLEIIGSEYLFRRDFDHVGLGIFNHWLSTGPIELWKRGEAYDLQKIKDKIHSKPEIERTTLNYQGLLFRFNTDGNDTGPYYGIKTPCCKKRKTMWVVDYNKIDYWMKAMLLLA